MDYKAEYQRWCEKANEELKTELNTMDEATIEDAFYRNLVFGTCPVKKTVTSNVQMSRDSLGCLAKT